MFSGARSAPTHRSQVPPASGSPYKPLRNERVYECSAQKKRSQAPQKLGTPIKHYEHEGFRARSAPETCSWAPQRNENHDKQINMKVFARAARRKVAPGRPRKLESLMETV